MWKTPKRCDLEVIRTLNLLEVPMDTGIRPDSMLGGVWTQQFSQLTRYRCATWPIVLIQRSSYNINVAISRARVSTTFADHRGGFPSYRANLGIILLQ